MTVLDNIFSSSHPVLKQFVQPPAKKKITNNMHHKPRLLPSLSLKIVSSSIVPYGENIILRSSSVAFLDIMPMNSLRSSVKQQQKEILME